MNPEARGFLKIFEPSHLLVVVNGQRATLVPGDFIQALFNGSIEGVIRLVWNRGSQNAAILAFQAVG